MAGFIANIRTLVSMGWTAAMAMTATAGAAAEIAVDSTATATVTAMTADSAATAPVPARRNLIGRVIDYFGKANVPRTDGRLDVSFIGGPHYSSDTNFGIGLIAAAHYGMPVYSADSTRSVHSEVAVFADISVKGCLQFGVEGVHIQGGDRLRLNYSLTVSNFPGRYWGIGYAAGSRNDDYSKYTKVSFSGKFSAEYRVAGNVFVGPLVDYSLIAAKKVQKPEFWRNDGQRASTSFVGTGGVVTFDSRDNITAPASGFLARAEAIYHSKALARPSVSFTTLEFTGCSYTRLWRGGVLASRLHFMMTTGNAPWSMLATFGGSSSMRGYYQGQYRDKDEIDLTVELRQKVWRRSGVVVWGGAATVFPKFPRLSWKKVLPNFGFGYRWEFKKNSNVRVDLGFGRGQTGFVFNINEAF